MTINNCQSNDGNRKSPFGKHHSDTFFSLDAKLKVKIGYLYCFKISFLEILINLIQKGKTWQTPSKTSDQS